MNLRRGAVATDILRPAEAAPTATDFLKGDHDYDDDDHDYLDDHDYDHDYYEDDCDCDYIDDFYLAVAV